MESIAEHLWKLEREWMEAVQQQDLARLSELLSDDFTLTSWASGGEVLNKQEYLADVPNIRLRSFAVDQCTAQVHERAAVVKCSLQWNAEVNGRPWVTTFLITDAWLQREGKWRVVTRHASLPYSGANDQLPRNANPSSDA